MEYGWNQRRRQNVRPRARTNFSGAPRYDERGSVSLQWGVLGGAQPQWSAGRKGRAPVLVMGSGANSKRIWVRVWPFWVMWRHWSRDHFFTPYAISYWWSFGTKPLFLTVSEIFNLECNAMVDMTLIRPLNKGEGDLLWYQLISHIRLHMSCQ